MSLPSLVAHHRVLLKEPAGPEVARTDVFKVNPGYTSRMFRVKINNLQMQ